MKIFFGFLGGRVKGQKMTHNYQFQSVTLYYISRTIGQHMKIVGTQVIMVSPGVFLYFLWFF